MRATKYFLDLHED